MVKIIGVDLGGTKVKAGLVSNDKLVKTESLNITSLGTQDHVIKEIESVIDKLIDKSVKAIGIGVPAIVDVEKGIVYEVNNIPSWKKVPLKQILQKKYKIPVFVHNDAKCFALGEKYFGKGKKYSNVVGLILGTGVGAGIVIDGKVYSGKDCNAGEFGEVPYKEHNLEYYCAGKIYERDYNATGKELSKRARSGDQKALAVFKEQGYHIGKLVATIVNALSPEIIIAGGSVTNDFDLLEPHILASLKEHVYAKVFSNFKIDVSTNKDIAVLGAASLYYSFNK
jgi:glucokinase